MKAVVNISAISPGMGRTTIRLVSQPNTDNGFVLIGPLTIDVWGENTFFKAGETYQVEITKVNNQSINQ